MSGRQAKAKRRANPVIHRKQLFGGKNTAEEVHSAALMAKGAKCNMCGAPPLVTYRSQALLKDLEEYSPQWVAAIRMSNPEGPYVPTFQSVFGPMVTMSTAYACKNCERPADLAATKHPSWVHVEIDRGPGSDNPVVGVA